MRPRVGDETGNFTVDWNFVDELNTPLAFPDGNSFCSAWWDPMRLDFGGIGEIRLPHYPHAQQRIPHALTGARHCGTDEQWSHGYPADTPGVTYNGAVPSCCNEDAAAFTVGFDFGFDA